MTHMGNNLLNRHFPRKTLFLSFSNTSTCGTLFFHIKNNLCISDTSDREPQTKTTGKYHQGEKHNKNTYIRKNITLLMHFHLHE